MPRSDHEGDAAERASTDEPMHSPTRQIAALLDGRLHASSKVRRHHPVAAGLEARQPSSGLPRLRLTREPHAPQAATRDR
jgi:hypothetical protein